MASNSTSPWDKPPREVGRYLLYGEIAAGGMATVHMGQLTGPLGFSRTVAIKRLHPQLATDQSFVEMFIDEARLAARIRHPNVVSSLDVVNIEGELFVIMDYVHGESLGYLMRATAERLERIPPRIVAAIMRDALLGLHAAHEATDDRGRELHIVHRDVSPQNILVGLDGVARVADFGVAKAVSRVHTTQGTDVKGKVPYMSPEQLQNEELDRRTDVFAAGVVLWEALVGKRLFGTGDVGGSVTRVLQMTPDPPSQYVRELGADVDGVLARALDKDRHKRFANAKAMAMALEQALPPASALEVAAWTEHWASERLALRGEKARTASSSRPPSPSETEHAADATVRVGPPPKQATAGPDVTETSLATGTPTRSRPKARLGIAAAALAIIALVAILLHGRKDARTDALTSSTPASSPLLSSSAVPVIDGTSSRAASTEAPASPGVIVLDSASPEPSAAPSAPTRKPHTAVRAPKSKSKANCTPPYTLNPDGSKRFKPECF